VFNRKVSVLKSATILILDRCKTFKTNIMKYILILLFPLSLFSQIREIPRTDIQDIAISSFDEFGPVIYYNPNICNQVGPLVTAFFKAHEYGHHNLKHIQREQFETNPYNRVWVRREYEKEADCWATRNVSQQVRNATIQFFAQFQNNRPSWLHPTGYERVNVILNCSL
jgi:hypothetical protein